MSLPPPSPSPSPSLTTKPTPPRRVPPPCWTHEETLALIESYHEKWYILRRGNLKASHWQEVADSVATRCRFAVPSKTSVQCRHKIEKLRKRYRTEKQRAAAANAPNRFSSSWNFFKKMDDMEKGPLNAVRNEPDPDDEDDEDDLDDDGDGDDDEIQPITVNNQINSPPSAVNSANYHRLISNGSGSTGSGSGGGGYRFRIPTGSRSVPSPLGSSNTARFDGNSPNFNSNPSHHTPNNNTTSRFMNSYSIPKQSYERSGSKRGLDPMGEMVASIRMLGEGFVKMEQKKIETAKEMEQMRMEMEMKRTEMILESQQKIVEAFAKGFSANKKMKRMPSPE